VRVLYAGDVAGNRIALVEGNWRWGALTKPLQSWFVGPRGAAATAMIRDADHEPQNVAVSRFMPADPGLRTAGSGAVVVVSSEPANVQLTGPRTKENSTTTAPTRAVPSTGPGVYEITVDPWALYRLTINGRANENGGMNTVSKK